MAKYDIVIKNEAGGGTQVSAPNTQSDGTKKTTDDFGAKEMKKMGVAAYGIAKRAVSMEVSHRVNTIELRTGHTELQQRYQMYQDIGARTFNVVEGIVAGLLVSGGNPIGAVIGAATSLAFQGLQFAQQLEERSWRMQEESIGISFSNIRAGLGRNTR